ncbi:hypothetical protein EVAR_97617_1 [Eumeta japonica]|uniref:Uncharacterized protein n=1 Tax=Eumeta variegata TaxID=151549 RepID=A0A4C1XKF5_EUMVA|nr:hypothetical protein EVAR_97617_1 [Eumeta japonica]
MLSVVMDGAERFGNKSFTHRLKGPNSSESIRSFVRFARVTSHQSAMFGRISGYPASRLAGYSVSGKSFIHFPSSFNSEGLTLVDHSLSDRPPIWDIEARKQ